MNHDLINQLRQKPPVYEVCCKAADEIERLNAQNEQLCTKFEQLRAQLNELGSRHPPLIFDDAAIREMQENEAFYQKQWKDRLDAVKEAYLNKIKTNYGD